ncbi:MAG: anti-sigma-I factor RsgI family protein [Bacillota bacterium]
MIQKGLVLSVNRNKVVVLTPDGQFLERTFRGNPPQIGSEIELSQSTSSKRQIWTMMGIAAMLALIFIPLLAFPGILIPNTPVAFVTIDINPSLELGLDKYERVISSRGLNEDGRELIDKIDLIGVSLQDALEIVTTEAIRENYIKPEKENAVIVSYTNKAIEGDVSTAALEQQLDLKQEEIENKISKVIVENKQAAIVEVVKTSAKAREEGERLGISAGKYTILLEVWEEGLEVSPESIRNNNIVNAIKEVGGNPGQVMHIIKEKKYDDKKVEELMKKYQAKLQSKTDKTLSDKVKEIKPTVNITTEVTIEEEQNEVLPIQEPVKLEDIAESSEKDIDTESEIDGNEAKLEEEKENQDKKEEVKDDNVKEKKEHKESGIIENREDTEQEKGLIDQDLEENKEPQQEQQNPQDIKDKDQKIKEKDKEKGKIDKAVKQNALMNDENVQGNFRMLLYELLKTKGRI